MHATHACRAGTSTVKKRTLSLCPQRGLGCFAEVLPRRRLRRSLRSSGTDERFAVDICRQPSVPEPPLQLTLGSGGWGGWGEAAEVISGLSFALSLCISVVLLLLNCYCSYLLLWGSGVGGGGCGGVCLRLTALVVLTDGSNLDDEGTCCSRIRCASVQLICCQKGNAHG